MNEGIAPLMHPYIGGRIVRCGQRVQLPFMSELQSVIDQAWEDRADLKPGAAPAKVGEAVNQVVADLDAGRIRVAEKNGRDWTVHQWVKKAVLLSFRLEDNVPMPGAATQ